MDREWIGLCEYSKACTIQEQLVIDVLESKKPIVLGFEHPEVITQGLRGVPEDIRDDNKIPVMWMRRGGFATLHSPGQLVVYPIFPLRHFNIGVKDFVCSIERATKKLLKKYEIEAIIKDGSPGVYTATGKIAFVGLQIHKGVSFHGLSLNVSNDLSLFSNITACGVTEQKLDSMQTHLQKNNKNAKLLELKNLFLEWVDLFEDDIKTNNSCEF